jgi:copper(I)-binding protein
MKKFAITCALIICSASAFAGLAADDIQIDNAYARAVPPGQPNSASFMTLTNRSDSDHAIIAGLSSVSSIVQLHTHTNDNGIMKMRQIERIVIPAGKTVELKPGGLHIMLMNLQKKLVPNENVAVTLLFADGSSSIISAPIRKLQMKMMKHSK